MLTESVLNPPVIEVITLSQAHTLTLPDIVAG
jgi:hypothetical protein